MKFNIKTLPLLLALPVISGSALAAEAQELCAPKAYEMALRYQQKSAEIMALQLQTYKLATEKFAQKVKSLSAPEEYAVVMDLDETVVDNSPLLVRDVENCHDFTQWDTWDAWEKKGNPVLIPGAKAFLETVDKAKVRIYYLSDRTQANKAATIKTLNALGLPQVEEKQILLLDTDSKEARRQTILKDHKILMLFGDSLPDFAVQFKNKKPTEEQRELVTQSQQNFGENWFVLPNASYGSWSKATLNAWSEEK